MNSGRTVFSQLIQHLPEKEFQKCVARNIGDSNFRDFPAGTSYWRWPSRNSPIAKACAISSPACALYQASCITWGSAHHDACPLRGLAAQIGFRDDTKP